jgi:hypothetical protein
MYKIRNTTTGFFSHGIVSMWRSNVYGETSVKWSRSGKTWLTEEGIKSHLLKCYAAYGIPSTWEIVEVEYKPTKPVNEWVDAKMLLKILKLNHSK